MVWSEKSVVDRDECGMKWSEENHVPFMLCFKEWTGEEIVGAQSHPAIARSKVEMVLRISVTLAWDLGRMMRREILSPNGIAMNGLRWSETSPAQGVRDQRGVHGTEGRGLLGRELRTWDDCRISRTDLTTSTYSRDYGYSSLNHYWH
jgi:hypothetical protein